MLFNRFNAFLLAFVVIGLNQCQANYLKYEILSDSCLSPDFEPNIQLMNESAIQSSIILESSQFISKTCAVRIITNEAIDGLVVNVQNFSIDNSLNSSCENFIEFDSPPTKWCESSNAKTLVIPKTSLYIAFNFFGNVSHYVKLVITPYKNSVNREICVASAPLSCQSSDKICISNDFQCDGFDNCPDGSDEKDCSITKDPEIIEESLIVEENIDESTDIPILDSSYSKYNLKDYCNQTVAPEISLKTKYGNSPAILYLTKSDSRRLKEVNCYVRFYVPATSKFSLIKDGLAIGIDNLSIGCSSERCDDYILISDSKSNLTKWTHFKTDGIGVSFHKSDYIDVSFHAGNNSNSSFNLIVTVIEEPIIGFCYSNSYMKCVNSNKECLNKEFKCDGHRNCPSGEDEQDCPTPPPTKPTTPSPTTTSSTTPSSKTTSSTTTSSTKTSSTTTSSTTTSSTTISSTTTQNGTTSTTTTSPTTPNTTTHSPITTTKLPTTLSPSTTTAVPDNHRMKPGIIALIVIGIILGVLVAIFIGYTVIKRRRANVGYNPLN